MHVNARMTLTSLMPLDKPGEEARPCEGAQSQGQTVTAVQGDYGLSSGCVAIMLSAAPDHPGSSASKLVDAAR